MKKWKCMIVDDEPVAIRVIEQYLAKLTNYEVVQSSTNAMAALDYLAHNSVDLLLLDIEMPGLSGLQLFKSLENPPALILITAHRNYAVDGFEINALDYLMKPVSFVRFVNALNRFEDTTNRDTALPEDTDDYLFVTVDRIKKKINLAEIIYIESQKDYIRIITEDEKILTRGTTTDFEERLPDDSFLRIHRSYIINKNEIDTVGYDEITVGAFTLPIGRSYKDKVKMVLGLE